MNRYHSYFDRVKVSNTLHQRLLSGAPAEKRRAPVLVRYGGLAACLALICLAGFGVWRWSAPNVGGDISVGDSLIPGEKDTDGPGETPPDHSITLKPGDPVGEPLPPLLTFNDRTNDPEPAMCIALPKGHFTRPISEDGCREVLGIVTLLSWVMEPYTLTGEVICDGEGQVWQVTVRGVSAKDADKTFTITLAPGKLPVDCVVYESGIENEIDGVSVHADNWVFDRDGDGKDEYVSRTAFMNGDVGVRVEVVDHADTQTLAEATTLAILRGEGSSLSAVAPEEIPKWRSEKLTLNEARAEERLGEHLPLDIAIPSGFAFESAYRELGQGRDWLSASWSRGYGYIDVTVCRAEFYQKADSDQPPIPAADLTQGAIEGRMAYVDNDAGDIAGYRGRFAVDFGDGFVAEYSLKGVTPEEAVFMTYTWIGNQPAQTALVWPVLGEYTVSYPFGERIHPITGKKTTSNGVGIKADKGTAVLASADGTVTQAGYDDAMGNYVKLDHGDDTVMVYGHVSGKTWRQGDAVEQGDVLGYVDQSGSATGAHLYLEFIHGGECLDPLEQYPDLHEKFINRS